MRRQLNNREETRRYCYSECHQRQFYFAVLTNKLHILRKRKAICLGMLILLRHDTAWLLAKCKALLVSCCFCSKPVNADSLYSLVKCTGKLHGCIAVNNDQNSKPKHSKLQIKNEDHNIFSFLQIQAALLRAQGTHANSDRMMMNNQRQITFDRSTDSQGDPIWKRYETSWSWLDEGSSTFVSQAFKASNGADNIPCFHKQS